MGDYPKECSTECIKQYNIKRPNESQAQTWCLGLVFYFLLVLCLVVDDDLYLDDAALVNFQHVEGEALVLDALALDRELTFDFK